MAERKPIPEEPTDAAANPDKTKKTQHTSSPASDPTNPHNQESTGDWVANERATERSNNEPGLTEHDRKKRRW